MKFMRLEDVAEQLAVNMPTVRALVKSGELPAIQIGGRGLWRVEEAEFEAYVQRQYAASKAAAEKLRAEQGAAQDVDADA